jgi:hypothetical protein
LHLFFGLVVDYRENRSSDVENKTKPTASSQREDDKRNSAHTRQKDAAAESCRGGLLLSTVSTGSVGD